MYIHTPGFQENKLTVLTNLFKEYKTNDTSFESPNNKLLESGKILGVASFLTKKALLLLKLMWTLS